MDSLKDILTGEVKEGGISNMIIGYKTELEDHEFNINAIKYLLNDHEDCSVNANFPDLKNLKISDIMTHFLENDITRLVQITYTSNTLVNYTDFFFSKGKTCMEDGVFRNLRVKTLYSSYCKGHIGIEVEDVSSDVCKLLGDLSSISEYEYLEHEEDLDEDSEDAGRDDEEHEHFSWFE